MQKLCTSVSNLWSHFDKNMNAAEENLRSVERLFRITGEDVTRTENSLLRSQLATLDIAPIKDSKNVSAMNDTGRLHTYKPPPADIRFGTCRVQAQKYRKLRTNQTAFALVSLLVYSVLLSKSSCNALILPQDAQSPQVVTEKILISATCTFETQEAFQQCPPEGRNLRTWLEYCNFFQICKEGTEPICIETNDGPVFLCSLKNLVCEPGMRIHVVKDRNSKENVILMKEKCPDGTYQTENSDCFHACNLLHRKYIPEQYVVYKYGDHMSETMVYCNYSKGYYNPEGIFLMNFDRDGWDNPYFCEHINRTNPCSRNGDQYPLPNGTCVHPCMNGQPRDDLRGFVCQPTPSQHTDMAKKMTQESVSEHIYNISKNPAVKSLVNGSTPDVNRGNTATALGKEVSTVTRQNQNQGIIITVVVVVIIVAFVIIVLVCRIKSGRWIWEGFNQKKQNELVTSERTFKQIVRTVTYVKTGKNTTINLLRNNTDSVENESDSDENRDAIEIESLVGSRESDHVVLASEIHNEPENRSDDEVTLDLGSTTALKQIY